MATDPRTIQFWPSGESVTYREIANDIYFLNGEDWFHATDDKARAIRIEEIAELLADRDILCCDSSLVDDMLKFAASGDTPRDFSNEWAYEEITNMTPNPDNWTIEECREYLDDHGYDHPETDEDADEDDTLEEFREAVRDNAEPAEIFEWWRVTKYLANRLEEIGECTLSNAYGEWWGRCTTGQGFITDGVLQRVAAIILKD